jgi:histidinol-phosphate aminotransferase
MISTKNMLNKSVMGIKEYVPGKSIEEIVAGYGIRPEHIIKLGSNENPLGPSQKSVEAVRAIADGINIYPSVDAAELRIALSQYVGYPADQVVMGAGMDGIVDTMMRLFIQPGTSAVITTPTFSYYDIAVRSAGGSPVFVKRQSDFSIDTKAVLSSIDESTRIVFLCSPNNPTGNTISEADVRTIVESTSAIVFLDEAYVEFAQKNLTGLAAEYENLVIGRTMSKAMGLAGLRIGYGIVPQWIYKEYMKVTTPFSISRIAVAAGLAALKDPEYIKNTIQNVQIGRKFLTAGLSDYCKVYSSEGNFILIDVKPKKSSEVTESLLTRGIIVRDCSSFRDAGENLIRITVGTPSQNKKVISSLAEILQS